MSTYMPKAAEVERSWYILDAADKPLGRVAATAAISIPSIMRIDVVFPAPLVPSSANTPGSFISKLRPSTALQLPYVLTMLSTLSDIISLSLIC